MASFAPLKALLEKKGAQMKLTWRQIEAFRAIMLTGTITQAAEFLSISQPAVSTLLGNLEHELGYKLFQRQHGRLVVTSEAEALYPEIERAFVGLDDISAAAFAIGRMQTGIVRLAVMPALAGNLLMDAMASFLKERPNISLNFEVQPRLTVLKWVATNRCDIGITGEPADHPAIETRLLSVDEAVCVLPRDHPLVSKATVTPEDLDGDNLICLPPETRSRRHLDRMLEETKSIPSRRVEVRTAQSLWQLVELGVGVGVGTQFLLSGQMAENVAVRPFKPVIRTESLLLYPRERPMSKVAAEFCEHLEARCNIGD